MLSLIPRLWRKCTKATFHCCMSHMPPIAARSQVNHRWLHTAHTALKGFSINSNWNLEVRKGNILTVGHRGNMRFACVWLLLPAPCWWYWLNGNAHAHTSGCADAPRTYTAPFWNIQHAPDTWRVQRATEHVASTIP